MSKKIILIDVLGTPMRLSNVEKQTKKEFLFNYKLTFEDTAKAWDELQKKLKGFGDK